MSGLLFEPAKCVRAVTKFSECALCFDACPVETISIAENSLPAFVPSVCVECGGCMGVCPGEAFSLKDFSATEFFFQFAGSNESLISCRLNVPCIMSLSTEHLISLALVKEELILDIGHCGECPYKEPLYELIKGSLSEANYVLEACGSEKRVVAKELGVEADESGEKAEPADRRSFLKALSLKGAVEAKREFEAMVEKSDDKEKVHEIDIASLAKIRKKELPDKRKILFTALKRTPKPPIYHTIAEDEISFVSQKYIEQQSCTNCQMCYRICPTGALSSDSNMSRIFFDAMLCIKCRACHDTCEPDAIKIQPVFEMSEFFEPTQRLLATFTVRKCDECGLAFTSLRGERVCSRCLVEEQEAFELWGIEEDEKEGTIFKKLQNEDRAK